MYYMVTAGLDFKSDTAIFFASGESRQT